MIYFWSFWGCVGSIFGRFGASWGVFWGSWRVLGGSWEALGGSWAPLEAVLGRHGLLVSFLPLRGGLPPGTWKILRAQKGAKMRPKSHPRGTKIEDKNEDEKR